MKNSSSGTRRCRCAWPMQASQAPVHHSVARIVVSEYDNGWRRHCLAARKPRWNKTRANTCWVLNCNRMQHRGQAVVENDRCSDGVHVSASTWVHIRDALLGQPGGWPGRGQLSHQCKAPLQHQYVLAFDSDGAGRHSISCDIHVCWLTRGIRPSKRTPDSFAYLELRAFLTVAWWQGEALSAQRLWRWLRNSLCCQSTSGGEEG